MLLVICVRRQDNLSIPSIWSVQYNPPPFSFLSFSVFLCFCVLSSYVSLPSLFFSSLSLFLSFFLVCFVRFLPLISRFESLSFLNSRRRGGGRGAGRAPAPSRKNFPAPPLYKIMDILIVLNNSFNLAPLNFSFLLRHAVPFSFVSFLMYSKKVRKFLL